MLDILLVIVICIAARAILAPSSVCKSVIWEEGSASIENIRQAEY